MESDCEINLQRLPLEDITNISALKKQRALAAVDFLPIVDQADIEDSKDVPST